MKKDNWLHGFNYIEAWWKNDENAGMCGKKIGDTS